MTLEIIRPNIGPYRLRVALFDFDGTVSLLRAGWQQIMIDMVVEVVPRQNGEDNGDVAKIGKELVHRTNGLPTLFQMQAIADLARARGAVPLDPSDYKKLFLDRVWQRVRPRLASIQTEGGEPEQWQLPGVEDMLKAIAQRRIPCYLVSGTDQSAVRAETTALRLDRYFMGIYGATLDAHDSTKEAVFARLVEKHGLGPNELVTFGDGVEEMRLTKQAGGLAIGIARDEMNPDSIDAEQRTRLVAAGADAIIKDFRVSDQLIDYLFRSPSY